MKANSDPSCLKSVTVVMIQTFQLETSSFGIEQRYEGS